MELSFYVPQIVIDFVIGWLAIGLFFSIILNAKMAWEITKDTLIGPIGILAFSIRTFLE